jgi:hypothetical protein
MVATSRARVALCDIFLSTWRVTVWLMWEANLGHFYVEFGDGPNIKFVKLYLLYNID